MNTSTIKSHRRVLNDEERESKIINQIPTSTRSVSVSSGDVVSEEVDIDGSTVSSVDGNDDDGDFNQEDHPDCSIISHQSHKEKETETETQTEKESIDEKDTTTTTTTTTMIIIIIIIR